MSKATTEQQLCGVIKLPEPAIDASVLDADRKMLMLETLWETEVLVGLLLEKAASQEWELENDVAMTIRGFVCGDPTGNAFEPVVRARYPAVERVFEWLGRHGRPRLSGSGGAVFMPITGDAAELLADCPQGMRAWTADGVDRSPLLRALEARRVGA